MIHDRGERELERRDHDDSDPGFREKAIRTISRAEPQPERRDEIRDQVGDQVSTTTGRDRILATPPSTGSIWPVT